ncbi:MAG: hypothetical protein WAU23_15120 [Ferruginibacter sp.]
MQIGKNQIEPAERNVAGDFVLFHGESYYKISNYDLMEPFFISVVSNTDHWMFVSSNGGVTAGRVNPDNALFPYYTVDKITQGAETTGSKTVYRLLKESTVYLWEPFSDQYKDIYKIRRNIYKSVSGNKIIFEEVNDDLQVSFSYQWMNSNRFGFIKRSTLTNLSQSSIEIELLDGLQNILPAGIDRLLQQAYSNLVNAYKKNELLPETGIGLFMLSSVIVDKAEPSEALKTTLVWSTGLNDCTYLLCNGQIDNFRKGRVVTQETDIRATPGAYFVHSKFQLNASAERSWFIIADVDKDAGDIAHLEKFIKNVTDIPGELAADIWKGSEQLLKILALADGLQLTNDKLSINRHLSNVLFNVMRGGIPDNNYLISKTDLLAFIKGCNKVIYSSHLHFLEALDETEVYQNLLAKFSIYNHLSLLRLLYEYLPFTFSRRHGDPSRPWNLFSIELQKEDGSKNLSYQGNWRDIFQNWEALSFSYPAYVEGMLSKFVNASTADGYNPYRITRDGIDWEKPDPHDPWANIGYWGDHQIIYLLKFLEISKKYNPGRLHQMLSQNIFAYANVPYRIKTYDQLIKDPFDTIAFSDETEALTAERTGRIGSDGKLLWDENNNVLLVNLTEKLLASVLAKLSNFIPEAGIWLNTQRPEWNDANNALVGNGVSMVTLYYLRRFQHFCLAIFSENPATGYEVSAEIADFFLSISACFKNFEKVLPGDFTGQQRRQMTDELGRAGAAYRDHLYSVGFSSDKKVLQQPQLEDFFSLTIKFIDHSIRKNKRSDNLYHAYNLVSFGKDTVSIRHLYEMLEGQVAVLSSGLLHAGEVIDVLDALKSSALFRSDQYSYMLYPDRQLPRFMEKNCIAAELIDRSELCKKLIADHNKDIVYQDVNGVFHFNGKLRNASDLSHALDGLNGYTNLVKEEKQLILDIFEKVFDHQSFTGRSGTFYGFEGLGCIYWHMVSKLLLAINENYFNALHKEIDESQLATIVTHYYDVRAGIGLNKSPELFGAFPTDAYSHTPGNGGAKQPGMTGQVKEDIISRFGELGIDVEDGQISFNPGLLRRSEFLTAGDNFNYINADGKMDSVILESQTLAFTLCQVLVVYHLSQEAKTVITITEGEKFEMEGLMIEKEFSADIFNKTGLIKQVDVYLNPRLK